MSATPIDGGKHAKVQCYGLLGLQLQSAYHAVR